MAKTVCNSLFNQKGLPQITCKLQTFHSSVFSTQQIYASHLLLINLETIKNAATMTQTN